MFTLVLHRAQLLGKQVPPNFFKGLFSLWTWFYTKPDRLISFSRRNLPSLQTFSIFCVIFTHFYGRKVKLPSVSQNQRWKHFRVHSNALQSTKNKALTFSQLDVSFHCIHVLCYVSVHFAVLWCSRQIFPLNESFNALLDDYRTREESCSQLLCDLWRHKEKKQCYCHITETFPNACFNTNESSLTSKWLAGFVLSD